MTKFTNNKLGGITLKNIKKIVAILAISMFAIGTTGCNMIAKTEQGILNSPVAKVNDDTITRKQLDDKMASIIAQLKSQYGSDYATNSEAVAALKQQKQKMLDQMVTETLVMQQAKAKNLIPKDSELNKEITSQFNQIKAKTVAQGQDWATTLSQAGYTETSLKSEIKIQIITNDVVNDLTKKTKITDKQIEDYYNTHQSTYAEQPDKVHFAHILVATEAEAKSIKDQLDKGADFAALAKQYSTDGSKTNGGDLGEVEQLNSGLDATFLKAGLALKVGEVSAPVHTQFGWHIIKCVSKTEYPVKKLADVKTDISDTLLQNAKTDAYNKDVASLKSAAKIKQYPENLNN